MRAGHVRAGHVRGHTRWGIALVVAVSVILPAGVSAASAPSAPRQWTVSLPETSGISGVTADAHAAYVVWADMPSGHSAAFDPTTGARLWHRTTVEFADQLAVAGGALWTTDGGTLVEQHTSTGRREAHAEAPAEEGFVTIAAAGQRVYAFSDGPSDQLLSVYDAAGTLVRRHSTDVPADAFCQQAAGGSDQYLLCIGASNGVWTLSRVSDTTGKTLASRHLPKGVDGGQSLAYTAGHVYVLEATGPGGSNTTPGRIVGFDPATLAVTARSRPLPLISIAAGGPDPVGLEINTGHSPTGVAVFDPDSMALHRTVPVASRATALYFAADRTEAFTVVYPPSKKQVPQRIVGVPLDG